MVVKLIERLLSRMGYTKRRPAYNPYVTTLQTPQELIEGRLDYVESLIADVSTEQASLSAALGKANLKLNNLHADKLQLQEWLVTHGND